MYTVEETQIFAFEYEGRVHRYDPIMLEIALYKAAGEEELDLLLERVFPAGEIDARLWIESAARVAPILAEAYGLKLFDGQDGVTAQTLLDIHNGFLTFCIELKKNTSSSQNSPTLTDSPPGGAADSTTNPSSDSSSTGQGSGPSTTPPTSEP